MPVSTRRMSAGGDEYARPRYHPTDRPSESPHRTRRVRARTPVEDDVTPTRRARRTVARSAIEPRRGVVSRVVAVPGRANRFIAMLARKLPQRWALALTQREARRWRKQD